MAVIVREIIDFGAGPENVEVFLPKGVLSKSEREQAERLDEFLKKTLRDIYEDMKKEGSLSGPELLKWYNLGRRLQFVGDPSRVAPNDLLQGHIWQAIRDHCPKELQPSPQRRGKRDTPPEREGHHRDHYHCCYEAGKYSWEEISKIQRWSDWMSLFESPGILRDPRVLKLVIGAIVGIGHPLTRAEFRKLLKALRKPFSTRPAYIEPSVLPDDRLSALISEALRDAGLDSC
jgi:hypothetical protein